MSNGYRINSTRSRPSWPQKDETVYRYEVFIWEMREWKLLTPKAGNLTTFVFTHVRELKDNIRINKQGRRKLIWSKTLF